VSGSGINSSDNIPPRSRQLTTPAHHHSSFFTGRMPFLPPNQQRPSTDTALTLSLVQWDLNLTAAASNDKELQQKPRSTNTTSDAAESPAVAD